MPVAEYGLSELGFRRKRLPEILSGLNERMEDKLGIPIQTGANSVFGQIHGVYAFALSELWEQAEKIYNAMYPSTAEGISLGNSAGLAGIMQIDAEKTTLIMTCYGREGAEVPFGATVASSIDGSIVFSNREVLKKITAKEACEIHLTVPTVLIGTTYQINLDGTQARYTATGGDDAVTVLSKLAEQFEFDDRTLEIIDSELVIKMNDVAETFSLSTSTVTISNIGTPFIFQCLTAGAIEPKIGTVTQIISNYSGWTAASNNKAANVGRDAETDTELRQRWNVSVYGRAMTMVDAIAAAIYQECTGVATARVYENTSDETDNEGRPPHSIEAVVSGGDPQDICDVILERKAPGIDTYGEISRTSYDTQGIPHLIYFNRPTEIKVWLKIEITTDDKEKLEDFGGLQNVKNAVIEEAASFKVGQDVILQKFYGVIYKTVTGIGYVNITATTGENPGTYTTKNIEIDSRHYATFEDSRIEVFES